MFAGGTCPQSDPAGSVYIGDSFATRFERFCRARAMSNGGLDPLTISLSVIGKGGARLSFATDAASRITSSKADRAIIHLGSNDLNYCVCGPKQLAADILNIVRRFIRVDGFKKVAICQLCYRYPPFSASRVRYPLRPRYNMLVDEVNAELRRLISFFPAIQCWKHRGMLLDYRSLVRGMTIRQTTANHHKPPQTTINHHKPPQTTANHRKLPETTTIIWDGRL